MPLTSTQKSKLTADVSALFAKVNALQADPPPPPPPPAPPPPPPGPPPQVLYTDAATGPTSGGEGGLGCFLSIFGRFGVSSGVGTSIRAFIGGVEVAGYRGLGPSKVYATEGIQQLIVQVGALGGAAMGSSLAVRVDVNGVPSNLNVKFSPCVGRVLFVALNGNDTTATVNDPARPWRNLQTAARGGAYATLHAGDHIVIRGGNWSDLGFETAWLRFRDPSQQGTAGAWVHITGYPGEDVHYSTPANSKGGIHGAGSAYYGTTGDYVSVSNLRMDVNAQASSDAAPINLQFSGGPWRAVNNELGPWPSAINSKAGGVAGHGAGTKVLGNRIFGMACTGAQENHGVYADSGASNWEIAHNHIHDITGGNFIQFFDNVGLVGNSYVGLPANWLGFTGMSVHHNWLENCGKYGLNLADGIVSGDIRNNVIKGANFSGLRINTISKNMDFTIQANVFYDNDQIASGSGNGQVLNTWGNYGPTGTVRVLDNTFAASTHTLDSSPPYANVGNTDAYMTLAGNKFYADGRAWTKPTKDATAVMNSGAMPVSLLAIPLT